MFIEILQLLSCMALGLLVGSLLTEAVILVPYWRAMDPQEFLDLHGTLEQQLYRYFAPLTIVATHQNDSPARVLCGCAFHKHRASCASARYIHQ